MIKIATIEDLENIKDFCLKLNIDTYYIEKDFNFKTYYVLEDEGIKAIAITRPTSLKVNKHLLKVSVIERVIDSNIDDLTYTHFLLAIMNYFEHQELITLISSDVKGYKNLGFQDIYYKSIYTFNKYDFEMSDTSDIKEVSDSKDLLDVYAKAMRYFDGYELRDFEHMKLFKEHLDFENVSLFGIYRNNLRAYFTLRLGGDIAYIDECLYLRLEDLKAIISYALKYAKTLKLSLSRYEKIERQFDNVEGELVSTYAARLNDIKLYQRLDESLVDDVKSVFYKSNKALWFKNI